MDCEISFRTGNQKVLYCAGGSYRAILPFAEIKGYSVLCEALNSGNTRCIAKVTANNVSKSVCEAISVINEPYLAWTWENALKAQEDGWHHLAKKRDTAFAYRGTKRHWQEYANRDIVATETTPKVLSGVENGFNISPECLYEESAFPNFWNAWKIGNTERTDG